MPVPTVSNSLSLDKLDATSSRHHFTRFDQVDQLVTASEADPGYVFHGADDDTVQPAPHGSRRPDTGMSGATAITQTPEIGAAFVGHSSFPKPAASFHYVTTGLEFRSRRRPADHRAVLEGDTNSLNLLVLAVGKAYLQLYLQDD